MGAVCDRLFTLMNEEAIEHIFLVLRRSCLMWRVMEVRNGRCGFLLTVYRILVVHRPQKFPA